MKGHYRQVVQAVVTIAAVVLALAVVTIAGATDSVPSEPVEVRTTAVRVASYNAWLLPIGADDAGERGERMGPAIDALEPDLVCLQEVWTEHALEPVAQSLAGRLPGVATGGGGLVVLSRWPIDDIQFEAFPSHTASSIVERLARKGFLTVHVRTPSGPLRVVNSHLTFDRSQDRRDHAWQLGMLVDTLRHQTDMPTILCADLNLRALEAGVPTEGFAMLLEAGFEDAAGGGPDFPAAARPGTRVGWPRAGRTPRWDPDYVLFRQGGAATLSLTAFRQVLDTEETALSDHNLQLADFLLSSP